MQRSILSRSSPSSLALALTVLLPLLAIAPAVAQSGGKGTQLYKVEMVFDAGTRSAIAATGADIFGMARLAGERRIIATTHYLRVT